MDIAISSTWELTGLFIPPLSQYMKYHRRKSREGTRYELSKAKSSLPRSSPLGLKLQCRSPIGEVACDLPLLSLITESLIIAAASAADLPSSVTVPIRREFKFGKKSANQKIFIDGACKLIQETVAEHLNIEAFSSSGAFLVADLGCSVRPNTFYAVSNVLQAVEQKYQSLGLNSQILEFQVFFNDHVGNDFNTLFISLPPDRRYHAAGVPSSFYSYLFPKSCLHFVYSSFALHWLLGVPKEVLDKNSPAWNKGRIFYPNANNEVIKAYAAQFTKDLEIFLCARAQEVVLGGLMVLTFITRLDGAPHSQVLSIGL